MKINVVDLFKNPNEYRAKAELGSDYFYNNRSVYSKNFTRSYHSAYLNELNKILDNDRITSTRLIDEEKNIYMFSKSSNNALQYFYFKNKKIGYNEITRIEEIDGKDYSNMLKQGYNNFYKLYKKNDYDVEKLLCVIAFVTN